MNWYEPWRGMLARSPPFRPLRRDVLVQGAIMTLVIGLSIVLISLIEGGSFPRAWHTVWITPTAGFGLAICVDAIGWICPGEVGTGPNAIVYSKHGRDYIIPWAAINRYEIVPDEDVRVLRIQTHAGEQIDILMPITLSLDLVRAEIDTQLARVRAAGD